MKPTTNKIDDIIRAINDCRQQRERVVVAIDGRSAAGKTTLALELGHRIGAPVIHLDHFFLRPEQRTKERLDEPGGNVDYERFIEEVLAPIRRGDSFSYRPFDCDRNPVRQISGTEGHADSHAFGEVMNRDGDDKKPNLLERICRYAFMMLVNQVLVRSEAVD
jgi:hypothetical protein